MEMYKLALLRIRKILTGKKNSLEGVVLDIGAKRSWDSRWTNDPNVLKIGDMYHLWYSGFDGEHLRIGLATSTDGINWTKYADNPVLDLGVPVSWDDYQVYNPCVLKVSDKYYMWYAGATVEDKRWHVKIGLAISEDGKKWIKYADNPVVSYDEPWEIHSVFGPSVMCMHKEKKFFMWYAGGDTPRGIGLATSEDGKNWIKYDNNPVLEGKRGTWEDIGMDRPCVIKIGDKYYMYYTGLNLPFARIGLATSDDGKVWVKSLNNPILDLGTGSAWDSVYVADGWVTKINNKYYMWYRGYDGKYSRIGLATSFDGVKWIKFKLGDKNDI